MIPGELLPAAGAITLNAGRAAVEVEVTNTGDRPIQVGSHFHFFEVNRALVFDREKAMGMHLNIPAGLAIRFEPGDEKEVELVEIGGTKKVVGFNGLVDGSVRSGRTVAQALERARTFGFIGEGVDQ